MLRLPDRELFGIMAKKRKEKTPLNKELNVLDAQEPKGCPTKSMIIVSDFTLERKSENEAIFM